MSDMSKFYDAKLQELYEASVQLRPFLRATGDPYDPKRLTLQHTPDGLREQAKQMEAKDAAIKRFRAALDEIAKDREGA